MPGGRLWERAGRSLACSAPSALAWRSPGPRGRPGAVCCVAWLWCWLSVGLPPDAGTCTNNTADDCVLPSGEVVSNCEVAADQWVVNDPSKPHCPHVGVTTKPPASTPSAGSPTPRDCASPLCDLIKDRYPPRPGRRPSPARGRGSGSGQAYGESRAGPWGGKKGRLEGLRPRPQSAKGGRTRSTSGVSERGQGATGGCRASDGPGLGLPTSPGLSGVARRPCALGGGGGRPRRGP